MFFLIEEQVLIEAKAEEKVNSLVLGSRVKRLPSVTGFGLFGAKCRKFVTGKLLCKGLEIEFSEDRAEKFLPGPGESRAVRQL